MSAVATNDTPTSDAAPTSETVPKVRTWTRTHEQEVMVQEHLARMHRQYGGADPELLALLVDETILGTDEVTEVMSLAGSTRAFQWYSAGRDLAAADQSPHPAGAPDMDATAGHRGIRIIRGSIKGRWLLWAMNAGKLTWNPFTHEFERQRFINSGGAPKSNP